MSLRTSGAEGTAAKPSLDEASMGWMEGLRDEGARRERTVADLPGEQDLEKYVEIELSGGDPAERFPSIAIHFEHCAACRADHDALVQAVEELGAAAPSKRSAGGTEG